jgi:hypothetical protein
LSGVLSDLITRRNRGAEERVEKRGRSQVLKRMDYLRFHFVITDAAGGRFVVHDVFVGRR